MINAMRYLPKQPNDLKPALENLSCSSLNKIIQKAKQLLALDRYFQTILPDAFRSYCHVMNMDQSILTLGVSNAAIATRIRFMSGELIDKLQTKKEFSHIQHIHCKVCAKSISFEH